MKAKNEPWLRDQGGDTDTFVPIGNYLYDSTVGPDCQVDGLSFLSGEGTVAIPSSPDCGQVAIVHKTTGELRRLMCKRRDCPRCRPYLARRIARQLLAENKTRVKFVDRDKWKAEREKVKRNGGGGSYKSIPQPDDELAVFEDEEGGEAIPQDEDELACYIEELLKRAPQGQNQSSSRGFGGSWEKAKPGNKKKVWRRSGKTWNQAKSEVDRLGISHTMRGEYLHREVENADELSHMRPGEEVLPHV